MRGFFGGFYYCSGHDQGAVRSAAGVDYGPGNAVWALSRAKSMFSWTFSEEGAAENPI